MKENEIIIPDESEAEKLIDRVEKAENSNPENSQTLDERKRELEDHIRYDELMKKLKSENEPPIPTEEDFKNINCVLKHLNQKWERLKKRMDNQ